MGRKSKADIRKPEILEHFYQVLSEEGYAGATLEKIATRMGVHSSLLVHYFKTKDDMMVALVESMTREYERYYLDKVDSIADPAERLKASLDVMFGREWTEIVDASVFYGPSMDLCFRNDRIMSCYRRMYGRMKEGVIRELKLYVEQGVIRKIDIEKTAGIIISMLEGLHIYRVFLGEKPSFEELSEYLKELAMLLLAGENE